MEKSRGQLIQKNVVLPGKINRRPEKDEGASFLELKARGRGILGGCRRLVGRKKGSQTAFKGATGDKGQKIRALGGGGATDAEKDCRKKGGKTVFLVCTDCE